MSETNDCDNGISLEGTDGENDVTIESLDRKRLPRHVAIIMDGNGRWAESKNLPRFRGHLEGVKRVEELSELANKLGIQYLTLYTFSTENWKRPESEVKMLMKTVSSVLEIKIQQLLKSNIKVNFLGRRDGIPEHVLQSIDTAIELTKQNTGMVLSLAFNYGSRLEIVDAVKKIASEVEGGRISVDDISENMVSQALYTGPIPDPDMLIRTSGEMRISNFLLWQLSYTELYFTNRCWPDFDEKALIKAFSDYQKRNRRYGLVSS
jgi:undecaprenyl diphosphate synthase